MQRRAPTAWWARRRSGFTFLELVLVLAVAGVIFAVSIPSLEGLAPRYRLRSGARDLASTLEQTRLFSINRGRTMGIRYVLDPVGPGGADAPPFYQVVPPAPPDYPEQPLEERAFQSKRTLPQGVLIDRILLPNGSVIDQGDLIVPFTPMGNSGSHIVVLKGGGENRYIAIKMNCITGLIEFYKDSEVVFENVED